MREVAEIRAGLLAEILPTRSTVSKAGGKGKLRTAILKPEPVESLGLVVGRAMAACAHPFAAWRVLSPSGRMIIVTAYFAAAYVMILAGLMIFSPASLPPTGF